MLSINDQLREIRREMHKCTSKGYGDEDPMVVDGKYYDLSFEHDSLLELATLRDPAPWRHEMATHQCPCGMTNEEWDEYTGYYESDVEDLWRDYHERGE